MEERSVFKACWTDRRFVSQLLILTGLTVFIESGSAQLPGSGMQINRAPGSGVNDTGRAPLTVTDDGGFVVVWTDKEDDPGGDILGQLFGSDGLRRGTVFLVNDDGEDAGQRKPDIASAPDGSFVIVWEDERNGLTDIYAQRYGPEGLAVGGNFRVNDDSTEKDQNTPSVGMNEFGGFVVAWQDGRNGGYDVYAQRFEFDGDRLGKNICVFNRGDVEPARQPAVGVQPSGAFTVVFTGHIKCHGHIYARSYQPDGSPVGDIFKVNEGEPDSKRFKDEPAIATLPDDCLLIVWQDRRNLETGLDLYGQIYDENGLPVGNNFRVNGDDGFAIQRDPSIAVDGKGHFITVWSDSRHTDEIYRIYGQHYAEDGRPLRFNTAIAMNDGSDCLRPDVVFSADRIILSWKSYRRELAGFDIWVKTLEWMHPGAGGERIDCQAAYPNPFFAAVTGSGSSEGIVVEYTLRDHGTVEIAVYNTLGQVVRRFSPGFQTAGLNRFAWDGKGENGLNVPAGVYVIAICVNDETRKITRVMIVH